MNYNKYILGILILVFPMLISASESKDEAIEKLNELQNLVSQAAIVGVDAKREEATVWFAKEFLKFADWDEANVATNEKQFGRFYGFKDNKEQMAKDLPEYERQEVIKMLDDAIVELSGVFDGSIVRRPVAMIDWENITVEEDQYTSKGKPVFLFDYFSKSHGNPTNIDAIYNDFLGNVDYPGSINPHWMNQDRSMVDWRLNTVKNHPDTRVGYSIFWHSTIPSWVSNEAPEVKDGRSIFIGYDIDNPTMRTIWDEILDNMTPHSKDKKFTQLGYCLVNEPHWISEQGHWSASSGEMQTVSSFTIEKFQNWLSSKYENVNELNGSWSSSFSNFNSVDIEIPISTEKRGTPIWYDWCRFNMDRGTEWITFLHDQVKEGDPNALTHVKIMTNLFADDIRSHGLDFEAITETLGMIGDDADFRKKQFKNNSEKWQANYSFKWDELTFSYDFMESVSPNKKHINSEAHFISTPHWREMGLSPDYVRSTYWLATLHGMDASLTWFWARDPDGSIEDRLENSTSDGGLNTAYAGSIAQQPRAANEIAKTFMDMNSYSEEMMALRRLRKPIRIFHSETSAINKENHISEALELYEALYFEGTPLGFATEKIINKQDHNAWDLVLVHRTEYATDAEFNALQDYLDNGGTVVIDDGVSLTKNEYGNNRSESLKQSNGVLHNMGSSATTESMKSKVFEIIKAKNLNPEIALLEENGLSHKGCVWRVSPTGNNEYLMTIVNIGKNEAKLKTKAEEGAKWAECTNLLNGEVIGHEFTLKPEGVLLLKVQIGGEATGVKKSNAFENVKVIGAENSIYIREAQGKNIYVMNLAGQLLLKTKVQSNFEQFQTPKGFVLVNIEGQKTLKTIVR